jgi:hypothetical protein
MNKNLHRIKSEWNDDKSTHMLSDPPSSRAPFSHLTDVIDGGKDLSPMRN